jgi:NADH-quinone oxidoreductase subunit N
MALMYAATGTMEPVTLAPMPGYETTSPVLLAGTALILTGLGFKLALVPFHMWIPDVYEGAAAPVTAFLATVSKGAVLAALLRFSHHAEMTAMPVFAVTLGVIAAASMIAGNVLALLQESVKRILAYSSIAHLGYILVAFVASGSLATEAVTFYVAVYFIGTLGAFGVIAMLASECGDADAVGDYTGLVWRRPGLATLFATALLSLAGIPLTAGFMGKFFLVAAGTQSHLWWLVILLALTSALGLYYYLRIIVTLFATPKPSPGGPLALRSSRAWSGRIALGILAALLLSVGVYPAPLERVIRAGVAVRLANETAEEPFLRARLGRYSSAATGNSPTASAPRSLVSKGRFAGTWGTLTGGSCDSTTPPRTAADGSSSVTARLSILTGGLP